MTLDDIKQEAVQAAARVELNWEQLDNITEAAYFTEALDRGIKMIPELEVLYAKLTSGKSIVRPDEPTSLKYDEIERYTELVAEELYAAYLIREVRETFDRVNRIIELSVPEL